MKLTGMFGLVLALAVVPLGFAGGNTEQQRFSGPGMMGGGRVYGAGMMGGGSWSGYGPGMMGGGWAGNGPGHDGRRLLWA